ncbi:MAG: hypothetical protein ACYTG3_09920 [Planctomycetota bacterium]
MSGFLEHPGSSLEGGDDEAVRRTRDDHTKGWAKAWDPGRSA